MRAAATRFLERTKLYILKGIEQNKLDRKKKKKKNKRIIYKLLNAEKGANELPAVERPRITPSRSSYSSGNILGNTERIAWQCDKFC